MAGEKLERTVHLRRHPRLMIDGKVWKFWDVGISNCGECWRAQGWVLYLVEEAVCGGSAVSVISWDSGGRKKRKEEGEENIYFRHFGI